MDSYNLKLFLPDWRRSVRHDLREDPAGHLNRRHSAVADAITDDFPNMEVVNYYIKPAVSPANNFCQRLPRVPDVATIAHICEADIGFKSPLDIALKFMRVLWPGLLLRSLMSEAFNQVCGILIYV